jgi:hypothetical protein
VFSCRPEDMTLAEYGRREPDPAITRRHLTI